MVAASPAVRRQAHHLGCDAEAAVAAGWRDRGFAVLGRRVRTGAGEIDLVVADAETLVFLEVKARASLEQAAYAVLPRQQQRLLQAAEAALAQHADWHRPTMRFDVALVCGSAIVHIEDAIRYH